MKKRCIAVLGSGGQTSAANLELARRAGAEIARRGAATVCGQLGGVFAAAFEGAHGAGGPTVALLGEAAAPAETGACVCVLATGLGLAKHAALANACDGAVLIEGWTATLAIVAEFRSLRKPVVALRDSGGVAATGAARGLIEGGERLPSAATAEEAVAGVFAQLETPGDAR